MRHFIATTDFSAPAANAAAYACALAADHQASLTLLHAYYIPVTFSDTPMPLMPPDDARKAAEQQMQDLREKLQAQFAQVDIKTRIAYGDLLDVLQEECSQTQAALVVMGNDGGSEEGWYGSELLAALRDLAVPVLGVPADYAYEPVTRCCLACDPGHLEDLPAEALSGLPFTTGPIDVLCVYAAGKQKTAGQKIRPLLGGLEATVFEEEAEDVAEAVASFLSAHPAQCLVLAPHKYSLLESLFHRSRTRDILEKVRIPVLALHHPGQG